MKNVLAIVAIVIGIFAGYKVASAADKQLCFPTDVGNVVITSQPCDIKFEAPNNFKYRAFATEGNGVHEGCWMADEGSVYILYPELQQENGDQPIAVYNPKLFTKCTNI